MRTNIDIDDELMQQAMAATGASTKKAAVEEALRFLVRLKRQGQAIEGLWGLATWVSPDEDWFLPDPLRASEEMGTPAKSIDNDGTQIDNDGTQEDEVVSAAVDRYGHP
jgi:hypothetical protein